MSRPHDDTSIHVGRAKGGNEESLSWVVARFSPALLLQASYRMSTALRRNHDPDDVIADVWMRALPHLPKLEPRNGRLTPVVLKFLSTTLLRRLSELHRKHLKGKPHVIAAGTTESAIDISDDEASVVTHLTRQTAWRRVAAAIESLPPSAREVVVLRGIEQLSNLEVAQRLSESEQAVSVRYRRALDELRRRLRGSIFEELAAAQ